MLLRGNTDPTEKLSSEPIAFNANVHAPLTEVYGATTVNAAAPSANEDPRIETMMRVIDWSVVRENIKHLPQEGTAIAGLPRRRNRETSSQIKSIPSNTRKVAEKVDLVKDRIESAAPN